MIRAIAAFIFALMLGASLQAAPLTLECVNPTLPGVGYVGQSIQYNCTLTGGTAPYYWSITGTIPGLSFTGSGNAAMLSGTFATAGSFPFTITVRDSSNPQHFSSSQDQFGVGPSKMSFTCTNPNWPTKAGSFYSNTCTASGGLPPYQILANVGAQVNTVVNGNTLTISGVVGPNATYNYSVYINVQDSYVPARQSITVQYQGTVTYEIPFQLSCYQYGSGFGSSTDYDIVGQLSTFYCSPGDGTPPYSFALTASTLPAGFSFSPSTGEVQGTFTASGPFSFTVRGTDSSTPPQTQSSTVSGIVEDPFVLTCASQNGPIAVGIAYNDICTAKGGTPPYTLSIFNPLPSGITAKNTPTTITLSGTPQSPGGYSYSVLASDSTPNEANRQGAPFQGTILQVSITCTKLSGPTITGQSYSTSCTASGGTRLTVGPWSRAASPRGLA